ncbi:hypothetical protein PPERSA_10021 [Pseudocohnilembus persalinus]|uniref:TLC domain-containing protein n=1 Tax=Pseudocohnilembus persalinus TaxID=266149 RepID=A0A0V0QJM7_PSEPJ|nr:hypothetical protein PPERSA_10021 [Pseudocohnilembus persalinus]|eukprot:KRX02404.1 hypothetical protein PPERSA_10021 [Pseudocohnilembus persalinus]
METNYEIKNQLSIEYPLDYYLLKAKLISDDVWVLYSEICLPVVFCIWLYKLFKPIKFKSKEEYQKLEKQWQDILIIIFVGFAPFYYLLDTFFLVYTELIYLNWCRFYLLLHHIASIIFLPLIIFPKYVPWWLVTPAWFHSVLLAFPQYGAYLNYPYAITLFISHFGFYTKVWKELTHIKILKWGIWLGYLSQLLMLLEKCDNSTKDYSYLYDPLHSENIIESKYPLYDMINYGWKSDL